MTVTATKGRRKITLTATERPPRGQRGRPRGAVQLWAWRLVRPLCGWCSRADRVAGRRLHEECEGTLSLPDRPLLLFRRELSAWPACTATEIALSRLGSPSAKLPCWCSCRGDTEMSWAELRGWTKGALK